MPEAIAEFLPGSVEATPELAARYAIPLFWLAAFDVTDILQASNADGFVVLCASGNEAANRLQRRTAGVAKLLPAAYSPYFEEWVRFVKHSFPHYVALRAEEIFSMEGYRDAGLRVTAALRALSPADEGKRIKELHALDYYGSFRDLFDSRPADETAAATAMRKRIVLAGSNRIEPTALDGWPRSPTAAELAFINGVPPAAKSPLSPDQAQLAKAIREGLGANSLREGFAMAAGKLSGRIPLGADAPSKTLRKTLGAGGELLELLRSGLFGVLALLGGPLFLWVGFSGVIDWRIVGLGIGCLVVAAFLLRSAARALRNLRTIMQA